MKVVSKEDIRVATLSGGVFVLTANEAVECADEIGLIAMQMGAKLVSESKTDEVVEEQPVEESTEGRGTYYGEDIPPEEGIPSAELVSVMEALIEGGDPVNFKTDGSPKANVVNKAIGRTVSTSEREAAWEEALNS